MLAKQYTINLPADYDMGIVRRRVASRGAAFDHFPGLTFKAFLITERARGAGANRYAPFYIWHDTSGANEFLYGDGFAAVQAAFGRPLVEHWVGLELRTWDRASQPARSATREDIIVPDTGPLARTRDRARDWLERCGADERGAHTALVALDPHRWQVVRFALWCARLDQLKPKAGTTQYELLHLSAPGLAPSPSGTPQRIEGPDPAHTSASADGSNSGSSSLDLERAPTRNLAA